MLRRLVVPLHRWLGLVLAVLLGLLALTGALLAWEEEIDALLNPQWYRLEARAPLPVFELLERIRPQLPGARLPATLPLQLRAGHPYRLAVEGKDGAVQYLFDPADGRLLGQRALGRADWSAAGLMPTVLALHRHLLVPPGELRKPVVQLLGVVALLWLAEALCGLLMTLPRGRHRWFERFRPAWKIKWSAAAARREHDLHRAGGLWLLLPALMFALSGVMFNLQQEVFRPAMAALGLPLAVTELKRPPLPEPLRQPPVDARAAHAVARQALAAQTNRGDEPPVDDRLRYDAAQGLYLYRARTSLDPGDRFGTSFVYVDARSAAVLKIARRTDTPGGTFSVWLSNLHMAAFDSRSYRAAVAGFGLVLMVLCGTGVRLFLRKRAARRSARMPGGSPAGT